MPRLQWFRATLNFGHVGAGRETSRTVYIQAPDALAAWGAALTFPGAKKSKGGGAGNSATPAEVPEGTPRRDLWYWRAQQHARRETQTDAIL